MPVNSGRCRGRNRYGSGHGRQGRRIGGDHAVPPPQDPKEGTAPVAGAPATDASGAAATGGDATTEAEKEYQRAKEIVLRQLTSSAKSRAQLEEKLRDREVSEEIIAKLLDRFEELGLVDDQAFAEMFVRSRARSRKLAVPALRRELAQKGITGDLAEQALEQRDQESEEEDARELVRKKIRPEKDLGGHEARQKATQRLASMLARRGYSAGTAFDIVRSELDRAAEEFGEEFGED